MRTAVSRALLAVVMIAAAQALPGQAVSPVIARGFDADKVYAAGEVDVVNLFNGNVNVPISLGTPYSVGPRLSYQFNLMYGGNNWEHESIYDVVVDRQDGYEDEYGWFEWSYPSRRDNAGFGWRLTFGRLYAGGASGCFEGNPTSIADQRMGYESPDGALHCFYSTLHDGRSAEQSADTFYTRDGTYLRLRKAGTEWKLEFPDGIVHTFIQPVGTDAAGVKKIEDRSGANWVAFHYDADLNLIPQALRPQPAFYVPQVWRISDSIGRTHYVYLRSTVAYNETSPYPYGEVGHSAIGQLVLAASHDTHVRYDLTYYGQDGTWASLPRDAQQGLQYANLGATVTVPLLQTVTRPTTTGSYEFDYDRAPECDRCSGVLSSLRLPTGGRVEWAYENLNFPNALFIPTTPFNDPVNSFTSAAVRTRTLWNGTTQLGKRSYQRTMPGGSMSQMVDRVLVTDFDADGTTILRKREHYFTACGQACQLTILPGEYALPFSRNAGDDGNGRYLSVVDYGPGSNWTEIRRRSYVKYEADISLASAGKADVNRRLFSQRTIYDDDYGRYADSVSSDFDGLGHYRRTTTSGNISGVAGTRTEFTNFNPNRGTYPDTFTMPAVPTEWVLVADPDPLVTTDDDPWILGTFDKQWASEPTPVSQWSSPTPAAVSAMTTFCFDVAGLLRSKRVFRNWAAAPTVSVPHPAEPAKHTADLLTVYTYDSAGNLIAERFYGGDDSALPGSISPTDYTCLGTPPSGPAYSIEHTYQYGVRKTSHYLNQAGAPLSFEVLDLAIDRNTGLPTESRQFRVRGTNDGVKTAFTYDELGRMKTAVSPTLRTQFDYFLPALGSSSAPTIETKEMTEPDGVLLRKSTVEFDPFGRPTREKRTMPAGVESERSRAYNALGWVTRASDWGATSFTTHKYDEFGRPKVIQSPDQTAETALQMSYSGVSSITRTAKVRTSGNQASIGTGDLSSAITTEVFDRQGRLVTVTEPAAGTVSTSPVTSYSYFPGGQLAEVCSNRSSTGGCGQKRSFVYDNRGFLRTETHPESGTTTYSAYDARGHVLRQTNGAFHLGFTYDPAERSKEVRELNANGTELRKLKAFSYYGSNASPGRNGLLFEATRHNWVAVDGADNLQVIERYAYEDPEGRVSRKETDTYRCVVTPTEPCSLPKAGVLDKEFEQSFAYDALGAPVTVHYPECSSTVCGGIANRSVTNTYDQGFLTKVLWSGAVVPNQLKYHLSGLLTEVAHDNTVKDTIVPDPLVPSRPLLLQTEGARKTGCVMPTFTAHPESRAVAAGEQFALTAAAIGEDGPTPTYTWYRGEAPDRSAQVETGPELLQTIYATTKYWVEAKNGCTGPYGTASSTATITVCAKPSVTAPPNRTIVRSTNTTLTASVSDPSLTFQWSIVESPDNVVDITGAQSASVTVKPASKKTYRVTVTNACGFTKYDEVIVTTVVQPAGPAIESSSYNGPFLRNELSWIPPSTGLGPVQYYVVHRSPDNRTWQVAGGATLSDADPLQAGAAYLYKVKSVYSHGSESAWGQPDLITRITFTDDPLKAPTDNGGTLIRARVVSELREAVDAVRGLAQLPPAEWTDPGSLQGLLIQAAYFTQLRAKLDEARRLLRLLPAPNTAAVAPGQPIVRAIVTDLWDGVK